MTEHIKTSQVRQIAPGVYTHYKGRNYFVLGLTKNTETQEICVVYRPLYEAGNYVPTVLPRRYDAFLFLDETQALHPLHEVQPLEEGEVPETFPTGV